MCQLGLLKCIKSSEEKFYTIVQTNPQRISFPCVSSVYTCTYIPKMGALAYIYISETIKNQGTDFTRNITQIMYYKKYKILFELASQFKENISSYSMFCSGISKMKNI